MATPSIHINNDEQLEAIAQVWDKRYRDEGLIWGEEPSETVQILLSLLRPHSDVLEVGFGYGRDLAELLAHGQRVVGLEIAKSGFEAANKLIPDREVMAGNAQLLRASFAKAALPDNSFDGLFAHRVLHLLGENGLVREFEAHAYRVLKPGAHLVLSARNYKDFNPDQMKLLPNGQVEYKDTLANNVKRGPGHIISRWNEDRFHQVFDKNWDIQRFIDGKEIESMVNPVDTDFTIMVATKKKAPAP